MSKTNYFPCLYWCDKLYVWRTNNRYHNLSSDRKMVSFKTQKAALNVLKKTKNEYDSTACKKLILEDKDFNLIKDVLDNDDLYFDYQKEEAIFNIIKDKFIK